MTSLPTGRDLGEVTVPVEAGKIAEFARAVHAPSPLHLDAAEARRAGLVDVVAPPTFTVTSAHHETDGRNANTRALERMEIASEHVLLGSCEWEQTGPVTAGHVLVGASRIDDVDMKTGGRAGRMTRLRVRTVFTERSTGQELVRFVSTLLHAPAMFDAAASEGDAAAAADEPSVTGESAAKPPPGSCSLGEVTRTGIVRYAGASGDFNPVHHDEVQARALGLPGVFAMGLYPGGAAAARLQHEAGHAWLGSLRLRFRGRVWPGDRPVLAVDDPTLASGSAFRVGVGDAVVIEGRASGPTHAANGGRT